MNTVGNLMLIACLLQTARGALDCNDEQVTFEKMTGVELKQNGVEVGGGMLGVGRKLSETSAGPTRECYVLCRSDPMCDTFIIDYDAGNCRHITTATVNSKPRARMDIDNVVYVNTGTQKRSVFNKICLTAKVCSKAWSFERVSGHLLFGYDDRIYLDVADVHKCQDLCLKETSFKCLSGEYDYTGRRCYLSRDSRRTQPASFRPATTSIDYFENQCLKDDSGCQYEEKNGVDLGYADVVVKTPTEQECQQLCDQSEPFVCRSFTFNVNDNMCRLSSDDTLSAGVRALRPYEGARYFQRTNCLDLKLLCTTESMIVTLHSREPFTGRIYAKTIPGKCEVSGVGKEVTRLEMPLVATTMDSVCGIVAEGDGKYSNTVVVQHHPLIQRRGDREVKLLCLFESASKTVSNSYSVVPTGLGGSATATVNATAPTPSIRLRITDKRGRDIKGTKLGAEIYLRIELDDTSAFGIFARDLKAHSGSKGDSLTLLDDKGCPVDPSIFPGLTKLEDSKTLQGKFEAFKFSEDVVVRFTLNVQFCISDCPAAQCGQGIESYGRKKRQVINDNRNSGDPILPDYPLVGEIIVEGSSVTQLSDEEEHPRKNPKKIDGGSVCISHAIVIVTAVTICVVILCVLCACAVCLMLNRRRRKQLSKQHAILTAGPMHNVAPPLGAGSVRSEYSLRLGSVFTNVDTLAPIDEQIQDDENDDYHETIDHR